MPLIFGFDIGTTSIGFAAIEHDVKHASGTIRRLGVRIFPEARDPDGIPLNQERRQARLRRRQLRRRRERRRSLGDLLFTAELLPLRGSSEWNDLMKSDPYELRRRAFDRDTLTRHEIGRAIYHLAQRRHFKGRELDAISDDGEFVSENEDDKTTKSARESSIEELRKSGLTLGAWLADSGRHDRKRGKHVTREVVEDEFESVWLPLVPEQYRPAVREAIFFQRPMFWRLNTLGRCRFVPNAPLCPKCAWISQQRRMLEKLNNLALVSPEARQLDLEERKVILASLQTQASMTWGGVRKALAPLYQSRGERGKQRSLRFNLEEGGEKALLGNVVEARLAKIFGSAWKNHTHKQELRDFIPQRVWKADYERVGDQRVVIRGAADRAVRRANLARQLKSEFGLSDGQAERVKAIRLSSGWEPYSTEALQAMLPLLEAGTRFGEIINGPSWKEWRTQTFPDRERSTGELMDRLPSPADRRERERIANLRNPTVARTRNELRKVVNNLLDMFGKPDLIRVEVARDVGNSKRQRDEKAAGIRGYEGRRATARKRLMESGIPQPSRRDVEKWLLWQECGQRCPYTGDFISFDSLFGTGEFEVEHIWPRSRSLDNSFRNKTLCRRDVNARKQDRTPYELFHSSPDEWHTVTSRISGMKKFGMSLGKIRRFCAASIPDDFVSRQLNDTGYAARQAVAYLKLLWPDFGTEGPVRVQAVSGRITAQLRRLWGLNNILADDGKKTRDDHRHHAIDALAVACCHPGITQKLSRYWQESDHSGAREENLPPPWPTIRNDAQWAVGQITVSHRVRRKISGPLHKETVYGDTGVDDFANRRMIYRHYVWRKNVEQLTKSDLSDGNRNLWPDQRVREIVKNWIDLHGGVPEKAFFSYPRRGRKGPVIRKVRLRMKRQRELMTPASTGFADLVNNHHIAIYQLSDGKVDYEVVSLLEASRRLSRHEPVVRRYHEDGAEFVMSLAPGDSLQIKRGGAENLRVVSYVNSNGQIVTLDHFDASKNRKSVFRPGAKSIIRMGGRKVSVDPIGRVRPAND